VCTLEAPARPSRASSNPEEPRTNSRETDVKENFADGWASVISLTAVWVGIFGGLGMIVISFLGCYAARKNKKMYLCCYLICVAVILALQIGAAVVMVNYSNAFKNAFSTPSSQLQDSADISVNNAVLSLYTKCCSGCPGLTANVNQCNNPGAYFPGVATYCYNRPSPLGTGLITCDQVSVCPTSGVSTSYCYQEPSMPYLLPPVSIDQSLCSLMTTLDGATGPLVYYVDKGGCGGGSVSAFVTQVNAYFQPKLYLIGVAFGVIAVIQSIVIFVGIYVILCVSRKDEDEYSIDDVSPLRSRR